LDLADIFDSAAGRIIFPSRPILKLYQPFKILDPCPSALPGVFFAVCSVIFSTDPCAMNSGVWYGFFNGDDMVISLHPLHRSWYDINISIEREHLKFSSTRI